ncbi:MAG: hypothetical protein IT384_12055 [Deltaproteobacteria bacterium]|nr:hypothetical protein [Deltaproteobacteria bacterium]
MSETLAGSPKAAADLELAANEAVLDELLKAMKSSGIPKAEQSIDALRRSGLDHVLTYSLAIGRLSHESVRRELDRFMKALANRTLTANDIKLGILALDEAAQRLAIAAGKGGPFRYPTSQNRARDSLITFARSLHR